MLILYYEFTFVHIHCVVYAQTKKNNTIMMSKIFCCASFSSIYTILDHLYRIVCHIKTALTRPSVPNQITEDMQKWYSK